MNDASAVLLREDPVLRIGHDLAPTSMQAGPRFRLHHGSVERLDATLLATAARQVNLPVSTRLLNATRDLSSVVAAEDDCVHVLGPGGHLRVPIANADSATYARSGRLLVTAPSLERQEAAAERLSVAVVTLLVWLVASQVQLSGSYLAVGGAN